MLIMKYTKTGTAAYLPHLDLLRDFQRIFRRAQIEVGFSEGFHPHMLLYFAPPLALGTQSIAEYCAIECGMSAGEFCERFNRSSTPDVQCVSCVEATKNPNLAAKLCYGEYRIEFERREGLSALVSKIASSETLSIPYPVKGEMQQREVRGAIRSIAADGCTVTAVLSQGNVTLRADRLADYMAGELGCEVDRIVRVRQLTQDGVDADELLSAL